jgi:uncharacterized protein YbjT (DUF2867 family)
MISDEEILVTGATGTVGLEVVKTLSKEGASIRAGSPSAQQSEDLRKLQNVETTTLDYHNHSSMVKAIEGVQKIFLVTPGFDMPEVTKRAVELAKKHEASHIVKLSVMGAESEQGDASTVGGRLHRAAENIIEESGIPFTFLRPNYFMQNFVTFHGNSIRQQSVFFLPWRDSKASFIDTRDIAAVAAKILIKDDDSNYKNKAYTLTGPEALSCFEVAEISSRTIGIKVNYVDIPEEHPRKGMKAAGMPKLLIDALFDLYRITREGHTSEITSAVKEITHRNPTSFAQFTNDCLNTWK